MTNIDVISDALVAMLRAAVPANAEVADHESLPQQEEDLPKGGLYGVFLFEDRPQQEDGVTDSVGRHTRTAQFKIELRVPGSTHMLHGTRAARKIVVNAVQADPTLGRLALDARKGAFELLVSPATTKVAAGALSIFIDYTFDPES